MAKHDIKAEIIQVGTLTRLAGKVSAKVNITYGEDRPLEEFDLVYRKYVDSIATGVGSPKTTLEVTGPLTINWDGTVPSGGQTFREKHGEDFVFQAYRAASGVEVSYNPTAAITRNGSGNITQVEFADVFPGRIIII